MSETLKHARLGITSLLIGVCFWLYFLLLSYLLFYTDFSAFIFPQTSDYLLQFVEFIALLIFYLMIPGIGFIAGIAFGFVGITDKTRKRSFAVAGLILNILPFIAALIYNLI